MAITTHRQTLDGENAIVRDANGWSATETYLIEGVTETDIDGRWEDALISSGLPAYGDAHPLLPINVNSIEIRPAGAGTTTTFTGTVRYGLLLAENQEPGEQNPPVLEVGATTQTVSTEVDRVGTMLKVGFLEKEWEKGADNEPDTLYYNYHEQIGTVDVQTPQTVFRYKRREPESPGNKSLNFVGRINSQKFLRFPPKTWLCTGITGTAQSVSGPWDVSYEFAYNPETWVATVAYVDDGGRVPAGVFVGDVQPAPPNTRRKYPTYNEPIPVGTPLTGSVRRFDVLGEADFRLLNVEQ